MAVSVGVLTAKLTLDSSEFSRGATKASADAKTLGERISGLNFRQLGMEIGAVGAVLTGVFGGAMLFAVKAASDLNESVTKSAVVFGESAQAVQEWAATAATSLGQSNQLALESAASFGNLFTTMGLGQPAAAQMSQDMVQLAADLASFNNQSPEEMLIKLRAGLVGEVEPLRTVGIAMNAVTVEAKAMEMGLGSTKAEISEADKVLARYALILEQSTNAQGDFARTADGVANQTRIAQAQVQDLATSFGQALLPAVQQGLVLFNKLVGFLIAMPDQFKQVGVAVISVTAAVGAAMVTIGGLVALLGGPLTVAIVAIVGIMAALTAAITLEWNRILQIFDGGVGGIRISFKNVATILGAGADAFAILARVVTMSLDLIVTATRVMVTAVSGAFVALKNNLAPILAGIATGNMGMFVGGLLNMKEVTVDTLSKIGGQFAGLRGRISQDVEDIGNHFTGKFKGAFERATDSVGAAVRQIGTDINKLKDGLKQSGEAAGKAGKAHKDAAAKTAEAWRHAVAETTMAFIKMRGEHEKWAADLLDTTRKTTLIWLEMRKAGFEQMIVEMKEFGERTKEWYQDQADAIKEYARATEDATEYLIRIRKKQKENEQKILQDTRDLYNDFFEAALGGWGRMINDTLKMLNSFNKAIPASIGGFVEKIAKIFGASTATAQKWAQGITGIIGGVSTFMSTRNQGLATGIMGGAMGGMQTGASIGGLFGGPAGAGIGAVIGGIGGAIAGIFGSGKSAAQKAEEERQKKAMAMDMEKTAIDIQGAAMDVMKKALDTFKDLADHVDVPKAAIQSFFKTLEKVTKLFLQLAAKFAKENMAAAKTFAETMGPVVELMGGALQAFDAIRFYTSIPERAINDMAKDLGRAAEAMGAVAIAVEDHIEKKAKRFADRVMPVIEVIAGAFEAFKSLSEYKGVTAGIFVTFFDDLGVAVNLMGELADNLSRNFLNKAKTYAERIGTVVQSIGTAVTALTSLRTYEAVPQKAFEALQHDIIAALSMIDGLVATAELYLDKAITFEDLVRRIVGALDAGVSLIGTVGGSGSASSGLDLSLSQSRSTTGSTPTGSGGSTVVIESLQYSGLNPQAQRVLDAVQSLLGQGGMPMTARAY